MPEGRVSKLKPSVTCTTDGKKIDSCGELGGRIWQFSGEAIVEGQVVATASFTGVYDVTHSNS